MTTLTETSQQQAFSMTRAYKETPGVKNLAKGYKLLPKTELTDEFGGILLKAIFITFMSTLLIAAGVYAAAAVLDISTLWSTVIILLLGTVILAWLLRPWLSWAFNSPESQIVINKRSRANLKKTRHLAAQLGESVVPVLTEEHITAIQRVREDLNVTIIERGLTTIRRYHDSYDQITVLLLEDLNREPLLRDIITNRGITRMDEIEEALRNIEENTITPLQSGWL